MSENATAAETEATKTTNATIRKTAANKIKKCLQQSAAGSATATRTTTTTTTTLNAKTHKLQQHKKHCSSNKVYLNSGTSCTK